MVLYLIFILVHFLSFYKTFLGNSVEKGVKPVRRDLNLFLYKNCYKSWSRLPLTRSGTRPV